MNYYLHNTDTHETDRMNVTKMNVKFWIDRHSLSRQPEIRPI